MSNFNDRIEINTGTSDLLSILYKPISLSFYTTQPRSSISIQSPPSNYLFL